MGKSNCINTFETLMTGIRSIEFGIKVMGHDPKKKVD